MIPVVTPDEMKAIDAAAPVPVEELVERAGTAVARAALRPARRRPTAGGRWSWPGRGNNGADGRVAARRLRSRGVGVRVVGPAEAVPTHWLTEADLVIDAAFGTGFVDRGGPRPVPAGPAPVLAVDIPSGVDALTGVGRARGGGRGGHRDLRRAQARPAAAARPGAGRSRRGGRHRPRLLRRPGLVGHRRRRGRLAAGPRRRRPQMALGLLGGGRLTGHDRAAHLAARAAQRGGRRLRAAQLPGCRRRPWASHRVGGRAPPAETGGP